MTTRLFLYAVIILGTTIAAHTYGHVNRFYEIWWFDIPMHYFGGVGTAFFGLWLASLAGLLPNGSSLTIRFRDMEPIRFSPRILQLWTFLVTLVAIAIVAPHWEVLEVFLLAFLQFPVPVGYIGDTILDEAMGLMGAITAWAVFYKVQYGVWQSALTTQKQPSPLKVAPEL